MSSEDGFLLVASPHAADEHQETVVLVAVHGDEGSLGFVLNRPSACRLGDSLVRLGVVVPPEIDRKGPTWRGGQTRPDIGWLIFDARDIEVPEDSCLLTPEIGVTASASAVEQVLSQGAATMLILGHLTWEADELDAEIREGKWMQTEVDPQLVFDAPATQRWSDATCDALEMPRPWWGLARFVSA